MTLTQEIVVDASNADEGEGCISASAVEILALVTNIDANDLALTFMSADSGFTTTV